VDRDHLLRLTIAVCLGLLVLAISSALATSATRHLRLRLRGRTALATVVRTVPEHVDGDVTVHDWTVVRFTTPDGATHDDVRLRTWSTVPPQPGRQIRVYYRPDDPHDVDRSRIPLAVAHLAGVPVLVTLGVAAEFAILVWGSRPR
jgi:hypothetical protein